MVAFAALPAEAEEPEDLDGEPAGNLRLDAQGVGPGRVLLDPGEPGQDAAEPEPAQERVPEPVHYLEHCFPFPIP